MSDILAISFKPSSHKGNSWYEYYLCCTYLNLRFDRERKTIFLKVQYTKEVVWYGQAVGISDVGYREFLYHNIKPV